MFYIGVDLHKNFSQIYCLNNETGEIIEKTLGNDVDEVSKFFSQFNPNCKVVVEATRNWYWFVDALQEREIDVRLSNPAQTKAIAYAKVKNDKVDAKTLTNLLKADLIPEAWIPGREQRKIREMLRARLKLVRMRTSLKNVGRSVLSKVNAKLKYRNIWEGEGREELERVKLKEPYDKILPQILNLIDILTPQIEYWKKEIKKAVKDIEDPNVPLLKTHPGVDDISAFHVLYEAGPMDRFLSAKHHSSYSGLAPKSRGSAGKFKTGHLSKQANMYLKWIYVEVATAIVHSKKDRLYKYYERIMRKKGKQVAKIALARKISRTVYHMLKDNIDYETFLRRRRERTG